MAPRPASRGHQYVLWQIGAGKRFDYGSPEIFRLNDLLEKTMADNFYSFLPDILPVLKIFPRRLLMKLVGATALDEVVTEISEIVQL